jgi:hypothetical protein
MTRVKLTIGGVFEMAWATALEYREGCSGVLPNVFTAGDSGHPHAIRS